MKVLITLVFICLFVDDSSQQLALEGRSESCNPVTETFVFGDHKFIFFTQKVTWDEANLICPSYKAHLATPDSIAKVRWLTTTWAQSDLVYIDSMWLGARKNPASNYTWTWVTGSELPNQGSDDTPDWPYWKRRKFRRGKDCLALMRHGHKEPAFADLFCGLMRPFICEAVNTGTAEPTVPLPTNWVKCNTYFYTLYDAEVTWEKALAYCRSHGKRLARLRDPNVDWKLRVAMTKSRPALETIWMGGRSVNGEWRWVSDGTPIPSRMNATTNYPPWEDEEESSKGGCLLFDKHFCHPGLFVALPCNKRRSFACEEDLFPPPPTVSETIREFPCAPWTCAVVGLRKTWFEAMSFCQTVYKTTLVKLLDRHQSSLIADAMADHPSEIKHAWIGGHHKAHGEWKWVFDNTTITLIKAHESTVTADQQFFFPPWCYLDTREIPIEGELCLNMDRTIYRSYIMYGLGCNATQPFVCILDKGDNGDGDR